jgi:hypothetical protein
LKEAQILIERWRQEYNTIRPHSALGYRPPAPEAIRPMPKWNLPIVTWNYFALAVANLPVGIGKPTIHKVS